MGVLGQLSREEGGFAGSARQPRSPARVRAFVDARAYAPLLRTVSPSPEVLCMQRQVTGTCRGSPTGLGADPISILVPGVNLAPCTAR